MSAYLRGDRVLPIGIPFMEENVQGLTLFGAKVGRELAEEDGIPPCSENLNISWMLLVMIYILFHICLHVIHTIFAGVIRYR